MRINAYSSLRYTTTIGKPDTRVNVNSPVTVKRIDEYAPDLQALWSSYNGYKKPQDLSTTAPQLSMSRPGKTEGRKVQKAGGEGWA